MEWIDLLLAILIITIIIVIGKVLIDLQKMLKSNTKRKKLKEEIKMKTLNQIKEFIIGKRKVIGLILLLILVFFIGFFINNNSNKVSNDNSSKIDNKDSQNISKAESKEKVKEEKFITVGDIVTIEDICEFNIIKTDFAKIINTPNKAGYISYYFEPKSSNNIYSDIVIDIKSLKSTSVKQNSLVSITIIYDDKYEYDTSCVTEANNGTEFEEFTSLYGIEPLTSLRYHFLTEVPQEVQNDDKSVKAIIKVNGDEYIYIIK